MDWIALVNDVFYAILKVVVPILAYYLINFLRAKHVEVTNKVGANAFYETREEILDLIISVVNSTSQTYVDNLKKEGAFTADAQSEAFNITKRTILSLINNEAKELLATFYTDVDSWINIQIENAVRQSKVSLIEEGILLEEE